MTTEMQKCPNCGYKLWVHTVASFPTPPKPPTPLDEAVKKLFSGAPPWRSFKVSVADVREALGQREVSGQQGKDLRRALENNGMVLYKSNGRMVAVMGSRVDADWLKLSS